MGEDDRGLLRFLTAGSVDDGKSTLIGRLLHDADAIYEDQLSAIRDASDGHVASGIDFSLVTDGLRAEREQGITIDVSYRYFSTPRRKFIVADSPGHEQYTRNMATGASTASLAVLLMDARKGVLPQTCRHAAIAWLMGIRDFAIVVNKMDLVDFREDLFRNVEKECDAFLKRLGHPVAQFIPCCAPDGDNVVHSSNRMPWYGGPSLLEYLESAPVSCPYNHQVLRFPIQTVIRSADGERYYAGSVASGIVQQGSEVVALPSGHSARISDVRIGNCTVGRASAPLSVTLKLDRELDLVRGDMLVDSGKLPGVSRRWAAVLLWMNQEPLKEGRPYLIKHTSRYVCGSVVHLAAVIDPLTLERRAASSLGLNEFAEVEIATHHPLFADPYIEKRVTGAFIVVEPISNETLAAGMITAAVPGRAESGGAVRVPELTQGLTIWFTGLSSAGKSSISKAVYDKLWAQGYKVELLDGDVVRRHLSRDLGFSKEDRDENIRRIGFMAEVLARNGVIVLVAAISPYRQLRDEIRARVGAFIEVYVNVPLEVAEQRDVKGLYRRYRAGEIHGVTGLDDPYEPPLAPEVECRTDRETLAQSADKVIRAIEDRQTRPW